MKKKSKWIKRNKIIRDMYDGKIIKDKEAISKRNMDIIAEKEGLINVVAFVVVGLLLFASSVNADSLLISDGMSLLYVGNDEIGKDRNFDFNIHIVNNKTGTDNITCEYYTLSENGTKYENGTLNKTNNIFSSTVSDESTQNIEIIHLVIGCEDSVTGDLAYLDKEIIVYRSSNFSGNAFFDLKGNRELIIISIFIIIGLLFILAFPTSVMSIFGQIILFSTSMILFVNGLWIIGLINLAVVVVSVFSDEKVTK